MSCCRFTPGGSTHERVHRTSVVGCHGARSQRVRVRLAAGLSSLVRTALTNGEAGYQCTKAYAAAGVVVPGGVAVDLEAEGFSSVKVFLLQNTSDPAVDSSLVVTVGGVGPDAWGPRTASVPSGQVDFATNDHDGWPVTANIKDIAIGGTVGTAYKFILFGN